jgi:hypothetical protein
MAGFQTQVGVNLAPAVEGDFASANPRYTFLAGPGGLISGPSGTYVGRFAWTSSRRLDGDNAPADLNNYGSGPPHGFVHREMQGLITTFLTEGGLWVPPAYPMTLFTHGDFWVRNKGATAAQVGMKVYANPQDGTASFAATGAPGTAVVTGAIAASTFSVTGSIAGNLMSVTAVGSGTVVPGATISGTGIATGTKVVSQLTPLAAGEATGGIGRYAVSIPNQTVASTTISGTYGTLTVSAVSSGTLGVGDAISAGTGAVVGTGITALGTGSGGTGTYVVDNNTVVSSTALTFGATVESGWYAWSAGLVNELVKINHYNPFGT